MMDPISLHYSFVVRCWRDDNGLLRGWVVDALTQRSYPFVTGEEMELHIENLAQDPHKDESLVMEEQTR